MNVVREPPLEQLVGRVVESLVLVQDYFQILFDAGIGLSVYCECELNDGHVVLHSSQRTFLFALRQLLGATVAGVESVPDIITLSYRDGRLVRLLLSQNQAENGELIAPHAIVVF